MSFFVRGRAKKSPARKQLAGLNLFNGDPDGLTFVFCLDNLLFQAVNPDAAVDDLTYKFVLAYEDAAFGVF